MNVIENENTIGIDIDNTLLLWDNPTVDGLGKVAFPYAGQTIYLTPHNYHIAVVKSHIERGYYVILWSGNGYEHARRAARVLGLDKYDIQVMSKLCKHMDDNPIASSIVGPRIFEEDLLKPILPPEPHLLFQYCDNGDGTIVIDKKDLVRFK
jgi:hydroxymethylpyrimidine pyrophosphatase-like HAD family hydrolase